MTWLPSLHFAKGMAYVVVMVISLLLFRQAGLENRLTAFVVALFYLPWVTKFWWKKQVDGRLNYGRWVLLTELLLSLAFIGLAMWLSPVWVSVGGLLLVAWLTAIHNVAADGLLRRAGLSPRHQVTGELSRKFSVVIGQGVLVMLAGNLQLLYRGNPLYSWRVMFYIVAGVYLVLFFWHLYSLPHLIPGSQSRGNTDRPLAQKGNREGFFFLFFYGFAVGMQSKMGILFLIDVPSNEGLGLSPQEFAFVMGTVGILSLTVGTLFGQHVVHANGLRRSIGPMSAAMLAPCVCYALLAYWEPTHLLVVCAAVSAEQLSYGFGFAAYLFFLRQISFRELGKSVMALSLMLAVAVGGVLQAVMGYYYFFLFTVAASAMTLFSAWRIRNFPTAD